MKNKTLKKMKQAIFQTLALLTGTLATFALKAEALNDTLEHSHGLYALDIIKMVLGIITIIGAFGFFITTSQKRAHWPAHFRRIFFGIFVFCNIISQALFNVVNIPANKKIICTLGKCVKMLSKKSL